MIKSCYIHIPFCDDICSYCDFCKLFYNEKLVDLYLLSLENEIKSIYNGEYLSTIYIGGGTPSCLSVSQLDKLLSIISSLNKDKNYEFTIECNFESTTKEKLELFKKYGINRLSFGLQSTDENILKFLNRKIDKNKIDNILKVARKLGFNNINIDLMYGIHFEDMNLLDYDLDYIFSLDVEHISTYSLIIEKNTILGINNIESIDEDIDYLMYKEIINRMRENGYKHYEISNFAKEGKFSLHNLAYWNNDMYYGFGLGASSYIDNRRITNTKSINRYLKNDFQYDVEILDEKSIIEYQIILNLRKREGINLLDFYYKFNKKLIDLYNYNDLINSGLLVLDDNFLFIPEDKWYISNEIIVRLLGSEVNE